MVVAVAAGIWAEVVEAVGIWAVVVVDGPAPGTEGEAVAVPGPGKRASTFKLCVFLPFLENNKRHPVMYLFELLLHSKSTRQILDLKFYDTSLCKYSS